MRALIATLLAVALLAPAARAKGPSFTEVCGASECRSVEDRMIRDALLGDAEQISPPRAGPFFTVRFLVRGKMVMGRRRSTASRPPTCLLPAPSEPRTKGTTHSGAGWAPARCAPTGEQRGVSRRYPARRTNRSTCATYVDLNLTAMPRSTFCTLLPPLVDRRRATLHTATRRRTEHGIISLNRRSAPPSRGPTPAEPDYRPVLFNDA